MRVLRKCILLIIPGSKGVASGAAGKGHREYAWVDREDMLSSDRYPMYPSLGQYYNLFKMEERHMARIAGVDLPRDKRVEIGLTYIYGIGRTSSNRILAEAGVNPDTRVRDLTSEEVKKISEVIDATQMVEGDLRREIQLNIKRLKEIGCYRGIRHRKGLPVRGQKTKTNARTCKGPKRTVANKKK